MEIEGVDPGLERDVSRYGLTSPEVVPLRKILSHRFLSTSGKEKFNVPCRAMLSLLEPSRKCSEAGFEVTLKEIKFLICFLRAVSYFCHILDAKDVFSFRRRLGRCHPCARVSLIFENMKHDKNKPNRRLAATTETPR